MAEVIHGMTRRAREGVLPGRIAAAAGLSVVLVFAHSARANLRAPRVIRESPSSALAAPVAPLTVEGEALIFSCGADSCLVTAKYEVKAAAASRVRLEFILPVDSPVTATTNSDKETVAVVPAAPLRPGEARSLPPAESRAPRLFRAEFQSELGEGANTIAVQYSQPLGAEETGYGYLRKKGRMVQRFRYELWPLREWSRSPSFRLKLAVAVERPVPGWWKRWAGTARSVACLTSDATVPAPVAKREQRGGQLWYEAELGPGIPDRITCFIGDEDLMPRN